MPMFSKNTKKKPRRIERGYPPIARRPQPLPALFLNRKTVQKPLTSIAPLPCPQPQPLFSPVSPSSLQKRGQSGAKPLPNAKGVEPLQSNPLIFMVLPARIERTAYRLGGDRSILLSYGSRSTYETIFILPSVCPGTAPEAEGHRAYFTGFLKMTEMPRRNFCRQFSQLTRDEQTLLFASRTLVKKGSADHTADR